jgi:hypothetical protein
MGEIQDVSASRMLPMGNPPKITFKRMKGRAQEGGSYMIATCVRCVRVAVVLSLAIAVSTPVYALLKFTWFYTGNEPSFGGNLCSGLASYQNEIWYANYPPGSPHKICVYNADTGEWTSIQGGLEGMPVSAFRFIDLQEDRVLVGGASGGALLDRGSGEWTEFGKESALPTHDLYSGTIRGDKIWFGTGEGIAILDSSGEWEYITTDDGLPNPKIFTMVFDGTELWVGTEDGILRLDTESEEKTTYSEADGLPGAVCREILIDGNNVWLALKGGIGRIDKVTGDVTSYTQSSHNLLSDEYKDIAIFGDKIYFACNRGVDYTSTSKEAKWKKITRKQGLPKTEERTYSDATHLVVHGDSLWIALWYEGIVQMTIPTGLAVVPVWVWVVVFGAIGVVALIVVRPGGGGGEQAEKEKRIEERRKKARTTKPPWETCGGVPQRQLCNRCKFNTLKAGSLFCNKYSISIKYQEK